MKFFILFLVATALNVTLSTIRSLVTIKGTRLSAATINAICYGFYVYIIVLTSGDGLSTLTKMLITAGCNFVCVYLVKWIDERRTPEKMWKIEMAISELCAESPMEIKRKIELFGIDCNYVEVGHWTMFNCYCYNKDQTKIISDFAKKYNGKMSAYESKI